MKLRLHEISETHAVYKAGKFSSLNNALLASVLKIQPDNVPNAVLLFEGSIENEQKLAPKLSGDYYSALIYAAQPRQLRFAACAVPSSLKLAKLSFPRMTEIFLSQGKKFVKKMGKKYADEHKSTILMLRGARHISFSKRGRPVSLFIMLRLKDYSGFERNWLCWDWAHEDLSTEEKAGIEAYVFKWMKKNLHGRIESKARTYDTRAQDYFRRHGFVPKALTVRGSINMLSRNYGTGGRK